MRLGAITTPQAARYFLELQQLVQAVVDEYTTAQAAWDAWQGEAAAAGVAPSRIIELRAPWLGWLAVANRIAGLDIPAEMARVAAGGAPGNIAQFDPPPPPPVPGVQGGGSTTGGFSYTTLAIAGGGALLLLLVLGSRNR